MSSQLSGDFVPAEDELIRLSTAEEIEAIGEESNAILTSWGGLASSLVAEYILRVGLGFIIMIVGGRYFLEWLGVGG